MTTFAQAVESVDELSLDEQESLVELVRRRIAARRRQELLQAVREAEDDLAAGKLRPMSIEEIMAATR